jgi:hypothetical protein
MRLKSSFYSSSYSYLLSLQVSILVFTAHGHITKPMSMGASLCNISAILVDCKHWVEELEIFNTSIFNTSMCTISPEEMDEVKHGS